MTRWRFGSRSLLQIQVQVETPQSLSQRWRLRRRGIGGDFPGNVDCDGSLFMIERGHVGFRGQVRHDVSRRLGIGTQLLQVFDLG